MMSTFAVASTAVVAHRKYILVVMPNPAEAANYDHGRLEAVLGVAGAGTGTCTGREVPGGCVAEWNAA